MSSRNWNDLLLLVAMGRVAGHYGVRKFGRNFSLPNGTREDVWDGGGVYPHPVTADITHLRSDNAGDVGISVRVTGLDADWNQVVQDVVLNGTSLVALATPLIRHRTARVNGASSPAGNIVVVDSLDAAVYAQITNPYNRTLMAVDSIPARHTGYLLNYYGSLNKKPNAAVDVELFTRPFGETFQLLHNLNTVDSGTTKAEMSFYPGSVPEPLPEKTDIKVSALADSAGVDLSAGFNLLVVKEGVYSY